MLEDIAALLQVDIYDLEDVLTQKSMVLRGEEIKSPLSVPQVRNSNLILFIEVWKAKYNTFWFYIAYYITLAQLHKGVKN